MLGELEHLPQDLDSLIFNSLSRKMTGVEDCTCTDTCWNIFPLLDLWAMPVTWIIVGPRHVSERKGLLNQETLLPLFRNFLIWCSGPDQTISCWFPSQNLFFFNGHWPGLTNPRDISDSFNGTPLGSSKHLCLGSKEYNPSMASTIIQKGDIVLILAVWQGGIFLQVRMNSLKGFRGMVLILWKRMWTHLPFSTFFTNGWFLRNFEIRARGFH